jgi:phytanoyl-CoA hydroxylase
MRQTSAQQSSPGPLRPEQDAQFRRDGFVVVRQVYSPAEIAEIRDTFMGKAVNGPVEGLSEVRQTLSNGDTAPYSASDPLRFYPRMLHPHNHMDKPVGPLSMKYMLHPKLESLLAALFGEEPVAVQSMFYFKPPESRGQALHQDNFYLRVKPGTCIAGWVAIDDADEENGGVMCVPNTHSHPIQCPEQSNMTESFTTEYVTPPEGSKAGVVLLKAGDVLFFNGNTIHGSGPNRSTTRFRRAFICHYVPRHTIEMSQWYSTPFRFNRERLSIPVATGGGPCGNSADGGWAPH